MKLLRDIVWLIGQLLFWGFVLALLVAWVR